MKETYCYLLFTFPLSFFYNVNFGVDPPPFWKKKLHFDFFYSFPKFLERGEGGWTHYGKFLEPSNILFFRTSFRVNIRSNYGASIDS